jgi:hypothetical protein
LTNADDPLRNEARRRNEARVTALMTAESIIVVFLFAYSPVINQTLLHWGDQPLSILTSTVGTGLVIYQLILIAFRSIHLLYKSIDTDDLNNENYRVGYGLFLMVIAGSCIFVAENALSILLFPLARMPLNIPFAPWIAAAVTVFVFLSLSIWVFPPRILCCVKRALEMRVKKILRRLPKLDRPITQTSGSPQSQPNMTIV